MVACAGVAERLGSGLQSRTHGFESRHSLHESSTAGRSDYSDSKLCFCSGAVDGFTFMGSTLPYELTAFVDHVVPILQRGGRFRTEYAGPTLRDHLGLARPSR